MKDAMTTEDPPASPSRPALGPQLEFDRQVVEASAEGRGAVGVMVLGPAGPSRGSCAHSRPNFQEPASVFFQTLAAGVPLTGGGRRFIPLWSRLRAAGQLPTSSLSE